MGYFGRKLWEHCQAQEIVPQQLAQLTGSGHAVTSWATGQERARFRPRDLERIAQADVGLDLAQLQAWLMVDEHGTDAVEALPQDASATLTNLTQEAVDDLLAFQAEDVALNEEFEALHRQLGYVDISRSPFSERSTASKRVIVRHLRGQAERKPEHEALDAQIHVLCKQLGASVSSLAGRSERHKRGLLQELQEMAKEESQSKAKTGRGKKR